MIFAAIREPVSATSWNGEVISPFTFGRVVSAKLTAKSRVDSPFSFNRVVTAKVTSKTNPVVSPFTFGVFVLPAQEVWGRR
jgi:hypothetical protein